MSFLLLLAILALPAEIPHGAIEATIRGTAQPLEADLLLRDANDEWKRIGHQSLPAATRRVRFEGLAPGVYQLLVRGPQPTEQLATKIALGHNDVRTKTIVIEPLVLTGRVTFGGTDLGTGALMLRHREFHWRGAVALAADGSFRAPLWQRGDYSCAIRGPALPTPFSQSVKLEGASPLRLAIDIPDGRVRGTVRDAKSGAAVAGALVLLQTTTADGETHVKLITDPQGRFDFTGIRSGKQIVRVLPPRHLEPDPIAFTLGNAPRLRELDVRVDAGRTVPIVVIDRTFDPVAEATVFAVSDSRIRARTKTDEDGRAEIHVPAGEPAALFVVGAEGPFAMVRIGTQEEKSRVRVNLPTTSSSLLIRALTTDGRTMPPFSLLMRYNGELVPMDITDELAAAQGLQLATGPGSEAHLQNIPSGSYEFWPYRTDDEAAGIVAAGAVLPPIQVDVRTGENKILVRFAAKKAFPRQ